MTPRRFALLVFAGLVVLQAAWIITVPPFRGSDEFDHVYRAAGVAEGQWRLSEPASDGRGLEVVVPAHIVRAASAQCDALPYPGPDNCFPIDDRGGDRVSVATAAGAYHPVFYYLLGKAGQPFDGAGADYAMRIAAALLCALGVGVAAYCLALTGIGPWTRLGFLVAITPGLAYTTSLPAPNGIEIVAGLCLWSSLFALLGSDVRSRHERPLLVVATLAAVVLGTVRMLGPMWLGLIVLTALAWAGWPRLRHLLTRRGSFLVGCSAVVISGVWAGAWWSMAAGMTGTSEHRDGLGDQVVVDLGLQPVVWLLQIVGAFPLRADGAPVGVYGIYLAVFLAMFMTAIRAARGRRRGVLLASAAVVAVLPVALTLATADTQGGRSRSSAVRALHRPPPPRKPLRSPTCCP